MILQNLIVLSVGNLPQHMKVYRLESIMFEGLDRALPNSLVGVFLLVRFIGITSLGFWDTRVLTRVF